MTRLDDALSALAAIGPLDEAAMDGARARLDRLTKPPGSLGRLEELVVQLAGITGDAAAAVRPARVVVAAADHGVAAHGVSAYPQAVTTQMVRNYLAGGAAVNVLAAWAGADVTVIDAGLATDAGAEASGPGADFVELPVRRGGTDDMTAGPAMTRTEAASAVDLGLRVSARLSAEGVRAIAVGEMGIGNTTAASAIVAAVTGRPIAAVTGTGTGIDDAARLRKVDRIDAAIRANSPDPADPLAVLAGIGGFEIGVLVGVILGGAAARIPVVLDGFITGAAALLAAGLSTQLAPRLIAAHESPEAGHRATLEHLGLEPLFRLGLRLGEGSGAALGLALLEAACRMRDGMATFAAAGVSGPVNPGRPRPSQHRR